MKSSAPSIFLYGLVALGPLVSALLGFVFISGLTRPVKVLVESTRKLKGGDLDHRVAGLKDEFGELADRLQRDGGVPEGADAQDAADGADGGGRGAGGGAGPRDQEPAWPGSRSR